MFKVKDVKVVGAKCRGIGGIFNCFKDKGRGKRLEVSVEVVAAADFTDNFSGERVGSMTGDRGELTGEGFGNVEVGGVDSVVVEGNGLVGGRGVVFAGKGLEEGPEFGRICSMVGFGKGFLPFFVGMLVYY